MKQYSSIYIPVDIKERKPPIEEHSRYYFVIIEGGENRKMFWNTEGGKTGYFDAYDSPKITHWLEKRSDLIVCDKEELNKILKHSFEMGDMAGCGNPDPVNNRQFHDYMDKYLESKGIKL